MRLSKTKGFWSFWFPVELTFAFSAIYEIIEWLTAVSVNPSAGLAFLGSQGDIWDAQKDMFVAGIGAIISMFTVFFIRLRYDKNLWNEVKSSLKPSSHDEILGEVKLRKLMKRSKFSKQ